MTQTEDSDTKNSVQKFYWYTKPVSEAKRSNWVKRDKQTRFRIPGMLERLTQRMKINWQRLDARLGLYILTARQVTRQVKLIRTRLTKSGRETHKEEVGLKREVCVCVFHRVMLCDVV